MGKLLAAYRANPTATRLVGIVAHSRKHPFAECLLCPDDLALLNAIKAHWAEATAKHN